jgi:lysophospholipase L1-like esterase
LLSDPVDFEVGPLSRLAISYYASGFIPLHTHHYEAQQTAFISMPGDFTQAEEMMVQQTTTSHYLLSAIYTLSPPEARAVICFGDSITDGYASKIDGDCRYPDILAERLQCSPGFEQVAVLNQGIGGNRILNNRRGAKALERFDDIVWPNTVLAGPEEAVNAEDIVAGYRQLLIRAKMAGLSVILGTMMPFEQALPESPDGGYYTPAKEQIRQTVNGWIRGRDPVTVIDFDALMRDERHPTRLKREFDSGDHIHPNDAGYRAMASAVNLARLQ